MPLDLTMCPAGDCPLRQRCLRYRGVPEGRQDWFVAPPFEPSHGTCEAFVAIALPSEETLRTRAYYAWLAEGRPEGRSEAHWEAARQSLEDEHRRALRDVP